MDHPAHALKCSLKMAAGLWKRSVLIFTCVLTPQASCRPQSSAIRKTILQMRVDIETSLGHLRAGGLLSGGSCSSLNLVEPLGPDGPLHGGPALSLFRCHMFKMSNITKELETPLLAISQRSQDVQELMPGAAGGSDCSLPDFQQDKDKFLFVRCLLELLDQVLSHVAP